jgi:hypothetical protein
MNIDPERDWSQGGPPPDPHQHQRDGAHRATNGHAHASPDDMGTSVAMSFLERFHPGAPWALASFGPGVGEVGPAQTFDPLTGKDAAFEFIRRLQGRTNIYFTVNRVGARIAKKAAKLDIIEIHYLHVDADLPKTLNWSDPATVVAAKQHMLEQLRGYGPPPTAIVWSGGGFQAFWRLSEFIVVNGDKNLMAPIERRMRHIEKAFGADACHNADRIMRLPGTINVLGPTKVRAGRRPERAELVEFHDEFIYDLEDFPEIEPEPSGPAAGGAGGHEHAGPNGTHSSAEEFERARDALRYIPADDYSIYLRVGMALKSGFGNAGFGLYREWAMRSAKFDENDLGRKWKSITPEGGVNIGTLFYMAKEHDWRYEQSPGSGRRERDRESAQGFGRADGAEASAANDAVKVWPVLPNEAKIGLVAQIASLATRNSEADPIAVKTTALVSGGALFGRSRFVRVGDTLHHARLFGALVGASSRARKGTSYDPVRRIITRAQSILQSGSTLPFPSGLNLKMSHGPLSSGEGLIEAIRDKRGDDDDGGVDDKRLLCIEGEFGAVLRACQRQGNTLSTIIRVAWDGWTLAPLTKRDKICATNPHICIIGHITRHELAELLTVTDVWNGFANRFLWNMVRRGPAVAFPQPMPEDEVERIAKDLAAVVRYAHECAQKEPEVRLSNKAADYWADVYPELTRDHPGILGAVTSRAEAQTLRLALTFALFDGADFIEEKHIEAALAFWRYCFDSAAYLFGDAELDPVAQTILQGLATGPKTQTEIRDLFARHKPAERLSQVLTDLQERGRITLTEEQTRGRPRRLWSLVQ